MIGYLRGEVLEHADGKLLLFASGAGVGYQVSVPASAEYGAVLPGQSLSLYIHTHVREDALDLFGFRTRDERDLFLTLLSVNGIGPKMAMGILSRVLPSQLVQAIANGDTDSLTGIPGIGKKTAERVVLELGDKIRKKMELSRRETFAGAPAAGATFAASGVVGDARAALVGLGYRDHEVAPLLSRILNEMETPPAKAEDLVRAALRQLV